MANDSRVYNTNPDGTPIVPGGAKPLRFDLPQPAPIVDPSAGQIYKDFPPEPPLFDTLRSPASNAAAETPLYNALPNEHTFTAIPRDEPYIPSEIPPEMTEGVTILNPDDKEPLRYTSKTRLLPAEEGYIGSNMNKRYR